MNSPQKAFKAMVGAIVGVALISGGLFYISDQDLQNKSKSISEALAEEQIATEQITIYRDARNKIDELSYIDEIAQEVLPDSKDQANVIAEIRAFADDSSVGIDSISFDSSSSNSENLNTTQTKVFEGVAGVRVLPAQLLFEPNASYNNLLKFLEKIEQNRRKIQVVGLSLTPNPDNRNTFSTITVDINIFLKGQ